MDESKSMRNLVTDFKLVCENKFTIGMIGSVSFLGESIGSFAYTVFSVKS